LSQYGCEQHSRACRFKRRAALLEEIDRILELAPGSLLVSFGQRDDSCGEA
jgi:hypothetical protein